MGAYAYLQFGEREVFSDRNEINQITMTLFQASERRIVRGAVQKIAPHFLDEERENAEEEIAVLKYESTVGALKDRLELMGFSYQFIEQEFTRAQNTLLSTPPQELEDSPHRAVMETHHKLERRVLEELTFTRWQRLFEKSWEEDKVSHERKTVSKPSINAPLEELFAWYVRAPTYEMPYGFLVHDPRMYLRLVCEMFSSDTPAIYDLTEIVMDCYEEDAEYVAAIAEDYLAGGYATTRRTIVLTEGRSDQRAIEGALGLLRPNLQNYFSFLDFETLSIQGGVSAVINTLKALISVGVANRIVAILDNDTAAHSAVESARLTTLPNNVRIIFLPDLKLAKDYPTLGPSGMVHMNINGLACSLELFFGSDIITDSSGKLIPIQWKGYDDKLRRYQGEVLRKQEIQVMFAAKLDIARRDASTIETQDWGPMETVIQSLVSAFHDTPPIDYGLEKFD